MIKDQYYGGFMNNQLEIRRAEKEDLPRIMEIIAMAAAYMKEHKIRQWNDGYPEKEDFLQDMTRKESYVCQCGGRIAGTAALCLREEPNYRKIYGGQWKTAGPYGVIHRIAVADDAKGQGVAAAFVDYIERLCIKNKIYSLRVDTHEDNWNMNHFLIKHGFVRCGKIFVEDGTPRVAYEKELER